MSLPARCCPACSEEFIPRVSWNEFCSSLCRRFASERLKKASPGQTDLTEAFVREVESPSFWIHKEDHLKDTISNLKHTIKELRVELRDIQKGSPDVAPKAT